MIKEITELTESFQEIGPVIKRWTESLKSVSKELDKIMIAHKTRLFTRTILITVFALIILTFMAR